MAKPVRGHGNVTGARTTCSPGKPAFPFAVNFSQGYPASIQASLPPFDLLVRGEADAMVVIASDPASNFPQPAIEAMRRIPVIVLDPKFTHTAELARVAFTTATYGINTSGTVYRMDDVPITLRPAFDSPYPSDEDVLTAIKNRLKTLLKDKPVEVMPPPLRA